VKERVGTKGKSKENGVKPILYEVSKSMTMTIGGFTPFNPVVLSMNWLKGSNKVPSSGKPEGEV
jgi:hypothetical protein